MCNFNVYPHIVYKIDCTDTPTGSVQQFQLLKSLPTLSILSFLVILLFV